MMLSAWLLLGVLTSLGAALDYDLTPEGILERVNKTLTEQNVPEEEKKKILDDLKKTLAEKPLNPLLIDIVGGIKSNPKERTYMAALGVGPEDDKNWICGGSLIAPKFILTAAHCTHSSEGELRWARLGDLDLSSDTEDAEPQDREVQEVLAFPGYSPGVLYNDIAVLRLDRPADLTLYVRPLCLQQGWDFSTSDVLITGWGSTGFGRIKSKELREARIDIFNDNMCQEFHDEVTNGTPRGIDSELMFCAGKLDGSKDSCLGDSGGPLVIEGSVFSNCYYTQIGVISYGNMCGLPNSLGIYTRISTYYPWIERIIEDEGSQPLLND